MTVELFGLEYKHAHFALVLYGGNMYTLFKGGARIAVIEADDVKVDLSNPDEPVLIFSRGGLEGCVEENEGSHVPYVDWVPKRKNKKEKFARHKHRDEAIKKRKDKDDKDKRDRADKDKRDKEDKEKKDRDKKQQDVNDKPKKK